MAATAPAAAVYRAAAVLRRNLETVAAFATQPAWMPSYHTWTCARGLLGRLHRILGALHELKVELALRQPRESTGREALIEQPTCSKPILGC